ncbi:glycosyltransferase family 2 protein [[Collinsella] massiliensis]|uniref:Glycosyl transferase family 2 n=1 Tax=[Collinsella] massiliensis TaxID=1232426 RepID=A0A1Y3XU62_9ACTN|nr:glycosyltransferase family 2 protein [[Collinsella] massiliensis]OUN89035.1 glycosyl transferase family 2 [[Collinsella] massiliensis]
MINLKTLIIIPAYNEEESLKHTVDKLVAAVPHVDYLIVNDGSTDSTVRVCRESGYPFLDLQTNLGLAGAFQAGMKYAYRHNYDCAIQFDADGQHQPQYIPSLEEAIKSYDIAIGSRFVSASKGTSLRMLGSNIIEAAIKLTTGKTIHDPTSGMRAFNSRMIRILATNLNMGPEPDTVSYLMRSANASVVEVPVIMVERTAGESYFNAWSSIMYMLRMTISILFIQFLRKKVTVS